MRGDVPINCDALTPPVVGARAADRALGRAKKRFLGRAGACTLVQPN